jgi:hypothetical protein
MTVYVDDAAHGFGRMIMCHMFSPDIEELHRMAAAIGVQRKWFQDPRTMQKVSWPHYDIAKSKRALALQLGAQAVDRYQMVAMACIVKHRYGFRPQNPLRWFTGHLSGERDRIQAWLFAETGELHVPPRKRTCP